MKKSKIIACLASAVMLLSAIPISAQSPVFPEEDRLTPGTLTDEQVQVIRQQQENSRNEIMPDDFFEWLYGPLYAWGGDNAEAWAMRPQAVTPTPTDISKFLDYATIIENADELLDWCNRLGAEYTFDDFYDNSKPKPAPFEEFSESDIITIRNSFEYEHNAYMPDEWFTDRSQGIKSFARRFKVPKEYAEELGELRDENGRAYVYIEDYEYIDDEGYITGKINAPNSYRLNLKAEYLLSLDKGIILNDTYGYGGDDLGIFPTIEEIGEYLTPAEVAENADIIQEHLGESFNSWMMLGNMDNDDSLTVNDIVYYSRQLVTQKPLNSVEFYQADIYQDYKIDVLDIVTCVHKIFDNEQ
jgi:hypothetical protein